MKKLLLFFLLFAAPVYAANGFIYDTFSVGCGTDIDVHSPDIPGSGAWVQYVGTNLVICSGKADIGSGDSTAIQQAYNPAAPPTAAYYVQGICSMSDVSNANTNCGVEAHKAAAANTQYILAINGGSTGTMELTLYREVNPSTLTSLALYNSADFAANTGYTVRLEVMASGSDVRLVGYLDNVQRIDYTDTDAAKITGAGTTGVYMRQATGSTNDTWLDNFQADMLRGNGRRVM